MVSKGAGIRPVRIERHKRGEDQDSETRDCRYSEWGEVVQDAMRTASYLRGPGRVLRLQSLRVGAVELGEGVTVSALSDQNNILIAIRFSHPIAGGGTCSKLLPIVPKKSWKKAGDAWKRRGGAQGWTGTVDPDGMLSLQPSVMCEEHDVHGMITDGEWRSFSIFNRVLRLEDEELHYKIERAIEEAQEFGGGMTGLLLALAGHQWKSDMSRRK